MYGKRVSKKTSPSIWSKPISKEIAPSRSYGSLSSVVQRVQHDSNSVSEDERQQLESAIGSRSTKEILAGKQTPWVPEFQGISAQLWGNVGQVGAPIQAKGKDDVDVSEVQPENKTGLPDNLKAGVENLSGYSLDDVKVHYNSFKPAQLQALAYTQGTDIYVAPGQEKHLPHEVWHVVQQMQERVKPTMQRSGVHINEDEGLEREADAIGNKARQINKNPLCKPVSEEIKKPVNVTEMIQRQVILVPNSNPPRWFSTLIPNSSFDSRQEAEAAERDARLVSFQALPLHFGRGAPYGFHNFPRISSIDEATAMIHNERVSQALPMLDVLSPENRIFNTSESGRLPTMYFGQRTVDAEGNSVINTGRIRQTHSDGALMQVDSQPRDDLFSHDQRILDANTEQQMTDEGMNPVSIRNAQEGMYHVEIEEVQHEWVNAHPSGGTLSLQDMTPAEVDEAILRVLLDPNGTIRDRRRRDRRY
ncbi:DUF4157 domain-containing protein [Nostoc sp. FACHB-110]|uniref:eCIS core domain-containing protein n=1 Tax=Nostoc sp. FACHB-110 TaxID=2692834 RepID=UPI001684152A|nr:DUF4157 domain-containing protein [Nostoc sp. FACHB-110]MBD2438747.1 DUF4157 domain-containing protein [Nostoc sp. FACHB-110]